MVRADSWYVLTRLQDLQGWMDYIVESLTQDQRYEKGKREILERLVEESELQELRDLAGRLRNKLYTVTTDFAVARTHQKSVV